MPKFEKHIPLSSGTGVGGASITTSSTTYVEVTPGLAYYDSAFYGNCTFYYEAVIKTNSGTAYAMLYDSAGNAVSGSEVSTTGTSATRVRSSAITLTNSTLYTTRIKTDNGANTNTYYSSRIIAVFNGTVTATESQAVLISNVCTTTSSSYTDPSTIDFGFFYWAAGRWDGAINIYFEAVLKTTAGTATVALTDASNNLVTNSECATTSSTYTRVRSSAISLSDLTSYKPRFKTTSGTVSVFDARIIIQQSGSVTKTESYLNVMHTTTVASSTGGTYQDSLHKIYFDPDNWSANVLNMIAEYNTNANTASGTNEIFQITSNTYIAGSRKSSANTSTMGLYRHGLDQIDSAMPAEEWTHKVDSAAGTLYVSVVNIVFQLDWGTRVVMTDKTANGNNIIVNTGGFYSTDVPGTLSGAVSSVFIDIGGKLKINDASSQDVTTALTIEGWVKRGEASGDEFTLLEKSVTNYSYLVYNQGGDLPIILLSGDGSTGFFRYTSTGFEVSTWHHWAFVYDGSLAPGATSMKIYRDGSEVGAYTLGGTPVGSLFNSSSPIYIGRNDTRLNIADLRLWNTARSQAQISANMNSYLVGNESGLVANWQFTPEGVLNNTNSAFFM